jgi:hypothetical protein
MSSATFRPSGRVMASALAALALIVVAAAPVAAGSPAGGRITKGDVTAAFQARTTGGYLNNIRGRTIAAPVRGLHDGRISSFNDSVLCSTDWHYLGVSVLEEGRHQVAAAALAGISITYWIDGVPVTPTTRLAVKPFVGTGLRGQWGVSVGTLVAPGSIADGAHSLETQISIPGSPIEDLLVTFTLAPDACGQA